MRLTLAAATLLLLTACGIKGPLFLPPKTTPPAAPAPATPAQDDASETSPAAERQDPAPQP